MDRGAVCSFLMLVFGGVGTAAAALAQVQFLDLQPMARVVGPLFCDTWRGHLLVMGEGEDQLYAFAGGAWRAFHESGPAPRTDFAACYDAWRGELVVFGGFQRGYPLHNDTWVWNGERWQQRFPIAMPAARDMAAMVFDPLSGNSVLWGGRDQRVQHFDTWQWDGAHWTQLSASGAPSFGPAIFDLARDRIVQFASGQTWTWARGTGWAMHSPTSRPPLLVNPAMAYDPFLDQVLLFGSTQGLNGAFGTWTWNGTTWRAAPNGAAPGRRYRAGMTFDPVRGRPVLFGGLGGNDPEASPADLWEWDGASWQLLHGSDGPSSYHRQGFALDRARGVGVLFGGLNPSGQPHHGTWLWDGTRWTRVTTGSPGGREAVMTYDESRQRVVMFGGSFHPHSHDDTWEWDGSTWSFVAPPVGPSARGGHCMVYDRTRQRVVMFGGQVLLAPQTQYVQLGDTWEWDGVYWLQIAAPGPSPRSGSSIAFDSRRNVATLFGGFDLAGVHSDTWEYDGSGWHARSPATVPPARSNAAMAYDEARAYTALIGGWSGGNTQLQDVWEWDGTDWRSRAAVLPGIVAMAAVYDPSQNAILLVARAAYGCVTLHYGPQFPADTNRQGSGCTGTAGVAGLATAEDQRPWLGDALSLRAGPAPAGAPALLWFGTSSTTWLGTPLPLHLDGLGLPGCALFTGIDLLRFGSVGAGGSADFAIQVPADPGLLGAVVFAQAALSDPSANTAGIVTTDMNALTIGGR